METWIMEDFSGDSSSDYESESEELDMTKCHLMGNGKDLVAHQEAVARLPRQKGHHKLKIRHQVPASDCVLVKNVYQGQHWHVVDEPALEKPTRSETLAAIKQAIENESVLQREKESQTLILATRRLSSVHEELRETAQKMQESEPGSACCIHLLEDVRVKVVTMETPDAGN